MNQNESDPALTILVVGATGSIGRHVVTTALARGYRVRALIRSASRVADVDPASESVVGDLTDASTLRFAVAGVDGIVFTQGSHGGAAAAESVDYGAVLNILTALDGRPVRIVLMTTIGVTKHTTGHDWKRRGERLVRVSGLPYTIVRPGWFDYNDADQNRIVLLQGDRRWSGDPSDGVISRRQIAEVLVASLTSGAAVGKTVELVAERGAEQGDLEPVFATTDPDPADALDGVHDIDNMPLYAEPATVIAQLEAVSQRRRTR